MPSVPEHLTIIDFIVSAGWLPQKCSVCDASIEFAWQGDPLFCRRCFEWAPQEIRIRLRRVQDIRGLLGFGEDDAGTSVRRALRTLESDPPPVIGHPVKVDRLPFMKGPLLPGHTYETYHVHGLSRWSPDQLNHNAALKATALRYEAVPTPQWAVAYHAEMMRKRSKELTSIGEDPEDYFPLRSEVLVLIGIVVIPDSEPYARYLLKWRPAAPWSGYDVSEERIQYLKPAQLDELRSAGKQFTDLPNQPGKRRGTFKRSKNEYLDALRDHAMSIGREPTQKEFIQRLKVDHKTLRRNLEPYGLWPWEEFLRRGLGSSRARTIKV